MSTRANVLVRFGGCRVWLYRHCDGYPAECGAAIAEAFKACGFGKNAGGSLACPGGNLVEALRALRYDHGAPIFEFTDDVHGDIEWCYEVDFNNARSPIRVAMRPRGMPEVETWYRTGGWMDLAGLLGMVNLDRRGINEHLANKKREYPEHPMYRDAEPYAMVEA